MGIGKVTDIREDAGLREGADLGHGAEFRESTGFGPRRVLGHR
jgi:hypothetical protein